MIVYAVQESNVDDRDNEYWVVKELFEKEADAATYMSYQDNPLNFFVEQYNVHSNVGSFSLERRLNLQKSALAKLTPEEREALGLTNV